MTRLTITSPAAARAYLASPEAQDHQPRYDADGDSATVHRVCGRCGGTGQVTFNMAAGHSRCFDCNNVLGRRSWTEQMSLIDLARLVRRKERAAARAQEKREARAAAWEAEHARNLEAVNAKLGFNLDEFCVITGCEGHRILGSLREAAKRWGRLTDAQEALAKRVVAEAALPKVAAPEGRLEFTGEIVSVRTVDSVYGRTVKCRIRTAEGWTCYGTMPAALLGEQRTGHTVSMRATLCPSDDDPTHAWFSRPSAARVIAD